MRDLRHALRSLGRSPGFVSVAIVALGIGLGLTTTMFGIIEAVLHPYVPFRDPDRLYSVLWYYNMRRPPLTSFEMHAAIRDETRSFAVALPVGIGRATMETGPLPGDVNVATVPARLPAVLGLKEVVGRGLTEADAGADAVVIGYSLARKVFGGTHDALGRTIQLGAQSRTIVGVMPRGMTFPMYADAWQAMPADTERGATDLTRLRTFVRLRPGVTAETAVLELELLAQRLTAMHQQAGAPFSIKLLPIAGTPSRVREVQKFMLAAAIAILLIACANLANLMLARGMAKRRELALRMALGASRWAVVRQQFVEAVLITGVGALVGVLVAVWGGDILANRVPRSMEWLGFIEPRLSPRVFALTALAAGAGAVLFGLIPALRLSFGVEVADPLKDGGTTTVRSHRRHSWLVVAQIAIALPLLVVAGVMLVVLWQNLRYEVSYAAPELLTGSIGAAAGPAADGADVQRFDAAVLATIRAVPGVTDAAILRSAAPRGLAVTAEMTADTPRVLNLRSFPVVSPEYLHTMGLAVIAGRDFEPGDAALGGAVVLDADAAAWLYPGQAAVGRMVKLGGPSSGAPWLRVVGVATVPNLRARGSGPSVASGSLWVVRPPAAGAYRATLRVRSRHADARLATTIVRQLRAQYPGGTVDLRPMLESHQINVRAMVFMAQLFVALGLCALGLGAVGLYGVVAYTVSERMREFAVRIALGADVPSLRRLVLHDGAVMVLTGTALGAVPAIGISFGGGSTIATLLLVGCEGLLISAMLAACLVPARRAARADPMTIMRAV
jgi:putative ABC transport system permease protein